MRYLSYLFLLQMKVSKCYTNILTSIRISKSMFTKKKEVSVSSMKVFHTDHTVDGSEIPRPTTGWMLRKPCKSWDKTDKTPTSTGVSITFLQFFFISQVVGAGVQASFRSGCRLTDRGFPIPASSIVICRFWTSDGQVLPTDPY